MKREEFFALLEDVEDTMVIDAREPVKKNRRLRRIGLGAAAACLALAILGYSLLHRGEPAPNSEGVTIQYIDEAPFSASKNMLIYLTEEELFTHFDTAIFKGTVTEFRNIQLDFNGDKSYRALAKIQVDHTYRGDCAVGEVVTVLLPCPITDGIWVEDTEIISRLEVGMTGIFMPIIYNEESYWEQNGATLRLWDVAEYGFADGMRYAFLETDSGLVFARHAYPSIEDAKSLEEIETFILTMIEANP